MTLLTTTDARGNATATNYDVMNRLTQVTDALGDESNAFLRREGIVDYEDVVTVQRFLAGEEADDALRHKFNAGADSGRRAQVFLGLVRILKNRDSGWRISEVISGVERVRIDTERNFLDVLVGLDASTAALNDPYFVAAPQTASLQIFEKAWAQTGQFAAFIRRRKSA